MEKNHKRIITVRQ